MNDPNEKLIGLLNLIDRQACIFSDAGPSTVKGAREKLHAMVKEYATEVAARPAVQPPMLKMPQTAQTGQGRYWSGHLLESLWKAQDEMLRKQWTEFYTRTYGGRWAVTCPCEQGIDVSAGPVYDARTLKVVVHCRNGCGPWLGSPELVDFLKSDKEVCSCRLAKLDALGAVIDSDGKRHTRTGCK